jgi:hypothetical protein
MFERSQMKHNSLDCHKKIWNIFDWLQSLHAQSLIEIKNVFACWKHSNFKNEQAFFKCPFFLPNVHHSFWKLEKILTLMIRRAKGFKLMNYFFMTDLNTFGSKVFLTLKIMDFENVSLTKNCACLCDRTHECIIYMI